MSAEDLQPYTGFVSHGGAYHADDVRRILADAHAHYAAQVRPLAGLAQPAGDPGMPVVAQDFPAGAIENGRSHAQRLEIEYQFDCEAGPLGLCHDWQGLIQCVEHLAGWCEGARDAIAARDVRIDDLEADLRERDERIASMRTEWAAEVAALTEVAAAAQKRIAELDAALVAVDALARVLRGVK